MEEFSKELLFAQTLEKVRQIAKSQGNYINENQVRAEFSGLDLSDGQLQMVFEYLAKYGIVDENVGTEEGAFTEESMGGQEGQGKDESLELQTYFDELAALPVYEKEELEAESAAAMAGDAKAQEHLMESLLKDVADIAKLYVGQGVLLEDLIGEGNMALAIGLQNIGSQGGDAALKSLSEIQGLMAKKVMDAMEAYVRENAANEKVDQKAAERVNLVADKARELAEELRRKVTPEELAQEAGLNIQVIQDAIRMSGYKIQDIEMAAGK